MFTVPLNKIVDNKFQIKRNYFLQKLLKRIKESTMNIFKLILKTKNYSSL